MKIVCFWVLAQFVTWPLTSSELQWPSLTFNVMVDDHILYLGLIWVCIPKIVFLDAVVNILYDFFFAIFQWKNGPKEGLWNSWKLWYASFFYQNPIFYPYRCFSQVGSKSDKLSPPLLKWRLPFYFSYLKESLIQPALSSQYSQKKLRLPHSD